jgi:predicted dienelactone hydrolase
VYLTDILAHPAAVPTLTIAVPDNRKLFGPLAGRSIPVVLLVMYPTSPDNSRPEYVFPYKETGDRRLPHMQRPGEKPVFAAAPGKFPLVVLSGGYNTHALWHLPLMKTLAAHGYVVIDVQHGDGRGPSFEANLALRVLELRAAIDFALQSPDFAGAIDAARIGVIGQSAGGHTILAAMGGTDPSGRIPTVPDPRIKAGFGLVPFMGGSMGLWPLNLDAWYFGEDHAGLRSVRTPFLAVYGEKDKNVPPEGVEAGVRAMSGPAMAVMFDGQTHKLYDVSQSDADTWEITFFDAWLKDDATAHRKLELGTSVRGGVSDHKTISHGPRG